MAFLFTAFGFTLAWKMETTQGFHAIVNLILFPLWMVSGAVFTPCATACEMDRTTRCPRSAN